MVDWLRWWHGTVTDTKFIWISRKAEASYGNVVAVWAALLETASQAATRGDITRFDAEAFDCLLQIEEGSSARIIEAMRAKGLIHAEGRLSGWEVRQPSREDSGSATALSSTERSRLHRANKRIVELEMQQAETGTTSVYALQRNATQATDRVDESRQDKNTLTLRNAAIDSAEPGATRQGMLCELLRQAGIVDAAPHYLDEAAWHDILSKRSDEEILAFAKIKLDARPGQRTSLRYLVPGLLEDPKPSSPRRVARRGARLRDDSRLAAARAIFGTELER